MCAAFEGTFQTAPSTTGGRSLLWRLAIALLAGMLLAACSSNYDSIRNAAGTRASPPPRSAGKLINVPASTYTVRRGDTLYGVASRTGADPRDIVIANGLTSPYLLQVGQKLTILPARYHVVAAGESTSLIAQRYRLSTSEVARLNGLSRPDLIQIGQRLRLTELPRAYKTRETQVTQASVARPATRSSAPRSNGREAPASAYDGRFSWPLEGRVLSSFGPKQLGLRNDGINIAATPGATVRSAASGTIEFAGSGIESFGLLVLIKHADGWVTAYGHNDALLVRKGDSVQKGEPIARAGQTGVVDRPQLHFQVRQGGRPVNPIAVLPRLNISLQEDPDTADVALLDASVAAVQ